MVLRSARAFYVRYYLVEHIHMHGSSFTKTKANVESLTRP